MSRTHFSRGGRRTPRPLLALVSLALLACGAGGPARAAPHAARALNGVVTAGLYNITPSNFLLRDRNTEGDADAVFQYGPSSIGFDCGYGAPYFCSTGWYPIAGDWDGNGTDTVGLYHQPTGTFFLKNSNAAGPADLTFRYGVTGARWLPVAGDWDGDGIDTVGLFDPASSFFFLKNTNAAGPADSAFQYGAAGAKWLPMVGDWDGNGLDTVGLYDANTGTFYLKNTNLAGYADLTFEHAPGFGGGFPLAGDWDGNGADSVGLYNTGSGTFYLKNTNAAGPPDIAFAYGPKSTSPYFVPVVGDWDGL